jgi:RuvB-like protein 2
MHAVCFSYCEYHSSHPCIEFQQSSIRGAGSQHASPHGIPADFLDRLLIVATEPYRDEELRQILHVRAVQEETDLEETALELLTRIAGQTSLRYAMQLIALSQLRATRRAGGRRAPAAHGPARVAMDDVEAVYGLFYDVKRSTQLVLESPHTFLFHENGSEERDDGDAEEEVEGVADAADKDDVAAPSPMVEG